MKINVLDFYTCPLCHGSLIMQVEGVFCEHCQKLYPRHPDGYLDLRPNDKFYADWISSGDQARQIYLEGTQLTESSGAIHMMEDYLLPLLKHLDVAGNGTVLSVGCGGGWDVETLQANRYMAWGIDNGTRSFVWKDRDNVEYLSLADGLKLPFKDDAFDFVFSEGVIEHIGYQGDNMQQRGDQWEDRLQFAREQLRVTKPGGYLLVACPNRLFPIDFYHGGKHTYSIFGMLARFHLPSERFLLSFSDIKSLYLEGVEWYRPLTIHNFFNLHRLGGAGSFKKIFYDLIERIFRILPAAFWGSAFSPYLVILFRKQVDE